MNAITFPQKRGLYASEIWWRRDSHFFEHVNEVRESPLFEQNKRIGADHPDIRSHGQFTKEHNQLKSVRENRFRSIEDN
jgi:hypothetical protein